MGISQDIKNILLINPTSDSNIYFNSKFRLKSNNYVMPLGLCCVAAPLIEVGHKVEICDLNLLGFGALWQDYLFNMEPDYIGITSTTSTIYTVYYDLIGYIKGFIKGKKLKTEIILGGSHATACPEETAEHSDWVCWGEGDNYILSHINMQKSSCSPTNLDNLPFPAYHLLDAKKYTHSLLLARKSPVGLIETSRGCHGRCTFCVKGKDNKMRFKSTNRVVDEMETLLSLGYREIHIIDDNFTADTDRVYGICDEIRARKLKFSWYPRNGIRVDRVSHDILKAMKDVGCYRIPFGVESGSQRVLDRVGKRITLKQVENAVWLAKKAGMETQAYFMIGLPGETKDDLDATCAFAKKLSPDLAKFSIMIPLPGTQVFKSYDKRGLIKSKDWSKYHFGGNLSEVYDHDTLDWDTIRRYSKKCYLEFYLNVRRIGSAFRILRGLIWNGLKNSIV